MVCIIDIHTIKYHFPNFSEIITFKNLKKLPMFNKDMLEKLQSLKQQADESKNRLEILEVSEESGGGLVCVTMNGNRKLKSVQINADLKTIDKEDLEDLLTVALSRILEKVNDLNEKEVMSSTKSLLPGM